MKKMLAVLLVAGAMVGGLAGSADAGGNWAISATWVSGYPVVRPAPCRPVVVAPAPVVYPAPVIYTPSVVYSPPVVYPQPVVYSTPVVYSRPVTTFGFTYGSSCWPTYRPRYTTCRPTYHPRPVHYSGRGHYSSGHHRR